MHNDLAVLYRPVDELVPYKGNARTHSKKQIEQIKRSIENFGFTNPVLIDRHRGVIAGHGRIAAAKSLGMKNVPCIELGKMTEAQKRAYIIADNKLAENAGWDKELLKAEFAYLNDPELDFDISLTGFEIGEIDFIINDNVQDNNAPVIEVSKHAVSRPGDIWQLGRHRVICGDALEPETYKKLLQDKRAHLVFTDPPYNVPISGHVCGKGTVKHDEFVMASGEMSQQEFTQFLAKCFKQLTAWSVDGSIHYICMDWRHIPEIISAAKDHYSELKNLCVWNKTNGGMGSLYRSKHELVFVYKNGTASHINNIELGKHGRYRTNVWDYAGINTFSDTRDADLAMHPTVKPVQMIADAIMDCSKHRQLILDCFGGSGTTLLAAEITGRTGYLIELSPLYVDVIIKRYEAMTNKKAVHAETGSSFADLQKSRLPMYDK